MQETRTFLFTDIQGSTRLLEHLGQEYSSVLDTHRRLLRDAVTAEGGQALDTEGDGSFSAFSSAPAGVRAALAGQLAIATCDWPGQAEVLVRMGLHTGEATVTSAGFVGMDVHRAARICDAGHGGQILVSETTRLLSAASLGSGVNFLDLGHHRLKDLGEAEHLFQVNGPGPARTFPPLRSLENTRHNLPVQLTAFIGRAAALDDAIQLLRRARLLTLTGPGGTGKTRLSLQIAAHTLEDFPDGVYFVPLAPIRDPDLYAPTVLTALSVREAGSRPPLERLVETVSGKRLLLLLDNFEQLLAAAPMVNHILAHAPAVKVMVTSRAPLRISGEQEFPVPPLGLPDSVDDPAMAGRAEAVTLFVERARLVRPEFELTEENAPVIAQICARLDGLPLAIELAAARMRLLSAEAILSRLDARLRLLDSGQRDLPDRQRTLRGAIEWSYDLLDDSTRMLLDRLSVFSGGWSFQHAEGICQPGLDIDVLEGLDQLAGQSLIRPAADARLAMLETIREFAAERLAERPDADEIRRRHATVFFDLAVEAAPHLTGMDQLSWLDRLEADTDNIRSALDFAEASDLPLALRMASALWRFWQMRNHLEEGSARLARLLAQAQDGALPLDVLISATEAAGGITYWEGRLDDSERWYVKSLEQAEALGDPIAIAHAQYNLSFPHIFKSTEDGYRAGRELLESALAKVREAGHKPGEAEALWGYASLLSALGDNEGALVANKQSAEIYRELGDRFGGSWALRGLGIAHMHAGDLAESERFLHEALENFAAVRDSTGIAILLDDLGRLATMQEDPGRAGLLAGAADALSNKVGARLAALVNEFEQLNQVTRPTESLLRDKWEEGCRMDLDQVIAYALKRPQP